MTNSDELRRDKIILLAILLLSSIFVLGCGIKGNEPDTTDVRYDMCAGVYTKTSSKSYNMIYYATNQETASGLLKDSDGNSVSDSSFKSPLYYTDDQKWVADGYVIDNDSTNKLQVGTYTFQFSVNSNNYAINKYIKWENIPTWKSCPEFSYDQSKQQISINNPGIVENDNSKQYTVKYSVKIYNAGGTVTQLVGQTSRESVVTTMTYSFPKSLKISKFCPVLVADFTDGNGVMQMVMYYCPEQVFSY